ncbi:MAG: cupredoxin domain-containing protein, partial [Acidimicrobiia bacterium]
MNAGNRTRTRGWLILLLFGASIALAPLAARAETQNVAVKDFLFEPTSLNITQGDQVVWKNDGQRAHTVTFADGLDSNPDCDNGGLLEDCLRPGETFDRTFTQTGEFKYRCKLHAHMTGAVVVAAAPTTTT